MKLKKLESFDISLQNFALPYLFIRLTIGVNMLPHGAIRFQYLDQFAIRIAEQFAEVSFFGITIIPYDVAYTYAILLCGIEAIIGIMLLIGFKVRLAGLIGGFMMVTLMFGKSIQHDWDIVSSMWMYVVFFFFIAIANQYDKYSLDWILKRKPRP